MIQANGIYYRYAGRRNPVFQDFDLQLEQNRIYGLLGKNGTGKSTLLYIISGLLRPQKGCVMVDGMNASGRKAGMLADMFLVTEEFELPPTSLALYVKLNSVFYPRFSEEVLRSCLADFELEQELNLQELSMGQKKKVIMSFALATGTRYLLMDEPTNGLDIPSKAQFRKVVARHMGADRTLVISTHQVHDVEQLLDHILILDQRRLLFDSAVADITKRYSFEYRPPQEMDARVLYAEPTLQGNAVIAERQADAPEAQLNLELLFTAVTQGKINGGQQQ